MKIVAVEFGYHRETRHIGMLVDVDGQSYRFIGPKTGPVDKWCVGAIDYLIRSGIVPEAEREARLAAVRETYTDAGYRWGDDGQDRKVPPLARVNQVN